MDGIEDLYKYVHKKKVFIFLISLDFTYLNKRFGYETTNTLKARILEVLHQEPAVFFKDMGSKLLFVFDRAFSRTLLNEINKQIVEPFLEDQGIKSQTTQSKLILFTTSEFGDFDLSFGNRFELFDKAYAIETDLKNLRGKIQTALKKENVTELTLFHDECTRLQELQPKKSGEYGNMIHVMRNIRNSTYQTKAAAQLFSRRQNIEVFRSAIVS